jgi:hypothetical protein
MVSVIYHATLREASAAGVTGKEEIRSRLNEKLIEIRAKHNNEPNLLEKDKYSGAEIEMNSLMIENGYGSPELEGLNLEDEN